MKRLTVFVGFLSIALDPVSAQSDDARKFGARESIESISVSPDGSSVAYLQPGPGASTVLFVAKADGSEMAKMVTRSDGAPWRLRWCGWASNARLVCQLYGISDETGQKLPFTRMIAINADGTEIKQLGQRASGRTIGFSQFDGAVVGWPATDNGEVLISRRYLPEVTIGTRLASSAEGLGVDRINTLTLKSSREEGARADAVHYIADDKGAVRILVTEDAMEDGTLRGVTRYYYRKPGSRTWDVFSRDSEAEPGLRPVAVDAAQNVAYAFGVSEGRDALFRVKLDGTLAREVVLTNDKVDIDGLLTLGRTGRVIGADFVTERRETAIFDPEYKTLAARLGKALPGLPLVQFAGASRDETKLLVFAGSDTDPGRYYMFDKATKRLGEIAIARPPLEGRTLSPVKPITYTAADGTQIPAYLTLPVGSSGKNLPAIVMPHGGPSARDEWGFDWLAQFYAAQGFAVIQPNFRGSAGYGEGWFVENGFKSWRVAIGDVNDAGRWLVREGIANPAKLAIVGWSYGGYAALQSGVTEPALFRAIVAIAPVTDLRMLIDQSAGFTNSALVARFVGSGEHVASGSPRQHAGKITAPVLMFSGDQDLNVDISHSREMDQALRAAGKRTELIVYKGLDHSIVDSGARADMLQRSLDFLNAALK
jgi:dipeptidyl aminopeptidase/acylaminoacyl peptidase